LLSLKKEGSATGIMETPWVLYLKIKTCFLYRMILIKKKLWAV
jgi:hypothetical protein